MKKIFSFCFLLTGSYLARAQSNVQGTIKVGPCANCVTVYMTPDASNSTAIFNNINTTLSFPTIAPTTVATVVTNNIPGMSWQVAGNSISSATQQTTTLVPYTANGRTYIDIFGINPAPYPAGAAPAGEEYPLTAGVEVPIYTVHFQGGPEVLSQIQLNDMTNQGGGANLQSYWYVQMIALPGQISPNSNFFYSSAGNSTTGTTSGDEYAQTNATVLLPLELTAFTAQKVDSRARLNWTTNNETDMDHYLVERSADAANFYAIGNAVNSLRTTATNTYQAYDNSPLNGDNYYRLAMVDKGGRVTYSDTRHLYFSGIAKVVVYPTLNTTGVLYVQLPAGMENAAMYVVNSIGQRIAFSANTTQGPNRTLTLQPTASGMYMLQVVNNGRQQNFKFFYKN